MINQYNFLNLSYVEFEELCRDLLEKEMNLQLESFSEGTDGGIDLRYLRNKNKQIIIQCKRYSNFKDLFSVLKKERIKIDKFENTSYKLATSIGMNPAQKKKIAILLSPYLESESDIITKKDLNALLRKYPDIEKRHFKLWINSTAVLESILKSKVINQSKFELDQISSLLEIYVVNPSFEQAEKILEEKRFVVISGIPGIGKTTLARVLAYTYLSIKKYSEFVYLSNSIDEGYEYFKEGVKQVFLFDDFLGQSFEDRSLSRNEDKRIIDFIRKINKSKDKVLLFTTREYILQDVQLKNELLSDPDLEFAKCLIDLSTYTELIKAKILYNHLFFSGLPALHLQRFANPSVYKPIISHSSYSPRLIENLIRQERNKLSTPFDFPKLIIEALDKPFLIWEKPFTLQINDLSKFLLTILLSMGTPVFIEDVKEACRKFFEVHGAKYFTAFNSALFLNSVKELENSFIISLKDPYNKRVLEFQNPSIRDFLLHYFGENRDQLIPVIEAAVFQEQLFYIFEYNQLDDRRNTYFKVASRILRDESLARSCLERIYEEKNTLKSCSLSSYMVKGSDRKYYMRYSDGIYKLLFLLHTHFINTPYESEVKNYIILNLQRILNLSSETTESREIEAYIELLKIYNKKLLCEPERIIETVAARFHYLYQYQYYFRSLEDVFPEVYRSFVNSEAFIVRLYNMAEKEIEQTKSDDIDSLISTLNDIQRNYKIDFEKEIKELNIPEPEPDDSEMGNDRFDYSEERSIGNNQIDDIFSSFRAFENI